MRYGVASVVACVLALPVLTLAHATPVETHPASGSRVESLEGISIRFSERLEEGSSRIVVRDAAGDALPAGTASVIEEYTLALPVQSSATGTYTATWSVVSRDDGHFTKGTFAFAIGSEPPPVSALDATMVQSTTYAEAGAIFVELIGNSLFWGALAMFALLMRPSLVPGADTVARLYAWFIVSGLVAVIAGVCAQVALKSRELAGLHDIGHEAAVWMYLGTTAGTSSIWRAVAALSVACLFFIGRRYLGVSRHVTGWEWAMVACLIVFAYFRGIVSHATANPFFPELSLVINIIHLVEKDVWFGALIALSAVMLTRARESIPVKRTLMLLTANAAFISMSGTYIIWLHLQDFSNIASTLWGEHLLLFLPAALLLALAHVHIVLTYLWRRQLFTAIFPALLGVALFSAGAVVFFSSLIIITSPPMHGPRSPVLTDDASGSRISLARSPYEDAMMLVTVDGAGAPPTVRIGGESGLLIAVEKRFEGGYVFPRDLIAGRNADLEVIAPIDGSYDARALFRIDPGTFDPAPGRPFDMFTLAMMAIALVGFAIGMILVRTLALAPEATVRRRPATFALIIGIGIGSIIVVQASAASVTAFGNDFKRSCVKEGNMWHLMLPAKAGRFVSETPREGCMMFSGLYHIADGREYAYFRNLATSTVHFDATAPHARTPTTLSFAFTDEDGMPSKLGTLHERLLHVVIVGQDMRYFAHIHPEDAGHSRTDLTRSVFAIDHEFPSGGRYLVSIDYLNGLKPESQQFVVDVVGDEMLGEAAIHDDVVVSDPAYEVEVDTGAVYAGDIASLRFTVFREGRAVTDMAPYLGAAMHVAIVKNDFSEFIHAHGEWHPPGYVAPPLSETTHTHALPPASFGPTVEAHATLRSSGVYTIVGEFMHDGRVVNFKTTTRAE